MPFLNRKYLQLKVKFFKFFGMDVSHAKTIYLLKNNRKLNLKNPQEFAEKIKWLKLFKYTEAYKNYVDKYEVRAYVKEKIGESYLNTIIGVYDDVDDINLDDLPNQFALKGTHGSGYNIIVKDKSKLDWKKAKQELKKYLSSNYYYKYRERIYKDVKPRILAEHYLDQLDDDNIIDYKFYCIHGKPTYIMVQTFDDGMRRSCFYDLQWNKVEPDLCKKDFLYKTIPKPNNLDELILVAEKLAGEFIYVRVDLYSIKDRIYYGELTFFPAAGKKRLRVERLNKELGDLIKLPI